MKRQVMEVDYLQMLSDVWTLVEESETCHHPQSLPLHLLETMIDLEVLGTFNRG